MYRMLAMNHLKNPLIIGGAVVCLILAGLAWNYTEAIKAKNVIEMEKIISAERIKEEELRQKQSQEDAKIAEDRLKAEQTKANEEQRQLDINGCLNNAQKVYNQNWNSSCITQADAQEKRYENCISSIMQYDDIVKSDATADCRKFFPAEKRTSCTLPNYISDRWDKELDEDEAACYQRYGFKN